MTEEKSINLNVGEHKLCNLNNREKVQEINRALGSRVCFFFLRPSICVIENPERVWHRINI